MKSSALTELAGGTSHLQGVLPADSPETLPHQDLPISAGKVMTGLSLSYVLQQPTKANSCMMRAGNPQGPRLSNFF